MDDEQHNAFDRERLVEIYRLHLSGMQGTDIAKKYEITPGRVSQLLGRARELVIVDHGIDSQRADSTARIDRTLVYVNAIIDRMSKILMEDHTKASGDEDAEPVLDLWPNFQAADRITAAAKAVAVLEKRRADLLGLDAPVKKEITTDGGLRYEIVGVPIEEITGEVATE